jgi:hypothetical protein
MEAKPPPLSLEPIQPGHCITPVNFKPNFHLQSIIYMPPGIQSSVSYGIGSNEGSRVAVTTTTGSGLTVGATLLGNGANTNYTQTIISGTAMSMTKMDQFTLAEFVNSGHNAPDRSGDIFDLWMKNVRISDYRSSSNNWEMVQWTTDDGATPTMFSFNGRELQGLESVVDNPPGRVAAFATLTPADKQAILSMDQPLQGTTLDTRRYQLVNPSGLPYSLNGPDAAGDPIQAETKTMSYSQSNDVVNGSGVNSSTTILAGFSVAGLISIGGSQTWTESFTDVRTTTTGAQNSASLTLRTPTVGCFMAVNAYIDAVFGTYLALPVPGTTTTHCN